MHRVGTGVTRGDPRVGVRRNWVGGGWGGVGVPRGDACRCAPERGLRAGHDVSDGGLLGCLLEMAFAGNCGLQVDVAAVPPDASRESPSPFPGNARGHP